VCGRQFTGKATRLHKLPGGFSFRGLWSSETNIGTKTADTPRTESAANDPLERSGVFTVACCAMLSIVAGVMALLS
jgi:hypothetical protein